jgi:hypothetical protein
VVHAGGGRRRGRSRILYWFRTPPGIRIGRSALDESAIRLIEEHNPDVEFDWTRILKGQDAPIEPKPPQQERRGKPRPREFPSRPAAPPVLPAGHAPPTSDRTDELPLPVEDAPRDLVDASVAPLGEDTVADSYVAAQVGPGIPPSEQLPGAVDEAAIEELLSDSVQPAKTADPSAPATAAQARLGSEGLSRLRARHAEVLARISETVTDPARRDELKSQAERLNPDNWVTDAEVGEGLEAYETVFESLRTVVGRRRRRRRRSGSRSVQPASPNAGQNVSSSDSAGGEEHDAEDTGEDL